MAAAGGIPTVIADGRGDVVLGPIIAGEHAGDPVRAEATAESAFKLWLRFGKPVVRQPARRRGC